VFRGAPNQRFGLGSYFRKWLREREEKWKVERERKIEVQVQFLG